MVPPNPKEVRLLPHAGSVRKGWFKGTASFLIAAFLMTQIAWAQDLKPAEGILETHTAPTISLQDLASNTPSANDLTKTAADQTSVDFLKDTLTLSAPEVENKTIQNEEASAPYDYERYEFEDALEQLRPEYASAVIVKNLTEQDLHRLTDLNFETAILVMHGETVIVTSGSEDEIGVLPAVKDLILKSAFISHTHPGIHSAEGPSGQDLNEAVESPFEEYVVTHQGVYAYNREGILNEGKPYSYAWYLEKLKEAKAAAEKDQVQARAELNRFIAEQDRYNRATEEERVTFRRGGTLAYTAGLGTSSLTSLAGSPIPYIMPGSSAATALSGSSDKFLLDYSVSATQSSGFSVSFDNAATSTVETQSISALTYLTFGFKSPSSSLKLEIIDINNVKDTWTLTNIQSGSEEFWQIPVSGISNTLDKTKIKQINFIVMGTGTSLTTGTLTIRAKGLNTAAPAEPVVTSTIPVYTNQTTLTLSGTKEAYAAILINNIQVAAGDSSTTWTASVALPAEGNNSISIKAKSAIGKTSSGNSFTIKRDTIAPTGTVNLNPAAVYTEASSVSLQMTYQDSGYGLSTMSFSTDQTNWSVPETIASSKNFPLPPGDGLKTISVRFFDKAGNASPVISQTITLDTAAPSGTISINTGAPETAQTAVTLHLEASDEGSGLDKMSFSSDGITWSAAEAYSQTKPWTLTAGDGNKKVYVKFLDKFGRWSVPVSSEVLLDTTPPAGTLSINSGTAQTSALEVSLNLSITEMGSGMNTMSFSTDGTVWSVPETYASLKTFRLPEGAGSKSVFVKLYDKAGNVTTLSDDILYQPIVNDGTQFLYQDGRLVKEITPQGDQLIFRADGSVASFNRADVRTIQYRNDAGQKIMILSPSGETLEEINLPEAPALDLTQSVRMTLDGGLSAYYINGQPVEFQTSNGIRITGFKFDVQQNITDALITYPDGTREIIRAGSLLRRISPDGTLTDYTPGGFIVRQIFSDRTDYYVYDKISQNEIRELRVWGTAGNESFYDELGILRKARDASGKNYEYNRVQDGNEYVTVLDTAHSSALQEKTFMGGRYDASGTVKEMSLHSGEIMQFENGRLKKTVDASGHEIQYSYQESQGLISGLQVSGQGAVLSYDAQGFLKTLTTENGTLSRTLNDQQVIEILLNETGGNTLSDFELDTDGSILKGIITTKEGVKQHIEQGVLTGFETVDGRFYKMQGQEAVLESWQFQDGAKVLYAGTLVSEILFPDGKRLHTLGFDAQKKINSFTEQLPDGTQKFFSVVSQDSASGQQTLKLSKLMTPAGAEIRYGSDGLAKEVILPDTSTHKVVYTRNAQGEVQTITFESEEASRTFNAAGELTKLLHEGAQAEITGGEVTKLFTRFGEVQDPEWTADGILSGDFEFVDGTRQVIENGVLVQTVQPDGKKINYQNGRIQSIQTSEALYELIYQDGAASLENVRLKIHSLDGVSEVPLIPYLLNPEYFRTENLMGHSVQYRGDSMLNEQSYKFGTASLKLDGAGDYLEILDGSSDGFQYGSEDFTIDFWFQADATTSAQQKLWSQYTSGSGTNVISLYLENGFLKASLEKGGQPWGSALTGTSAAAPGAWNHAALVRHGNEIAIYLNGQKEAQTAVSGEAPSGSFSVSAGTTYSGSGWSSFFKGSMDEIRISKGIARWNGHFTPSAVNESGDEFTKLLLHFSQEVDEAALAEDADIRSVLLPHSLYDTLGGSLNIQSQFQNGQDVFVAKIVPDTERETVYQFGGTFAPDWGSLTTGGSLNLGYIGSSESVKGWADMPAKASMMLDINGDGFADRVWIENTNQTYWKVQLNDGLNFQPAVIWSGVDPYYSQGMLEAYNIHQEHILATLADINGDHKPDRILQKNNGEKIWYVQLNNGSGFNPAQVWEDNLQPLSSAPLSATFASEARNDTGGKPVQEMIADLIDMDGDGLPDRVVRPYVAPFTHWFVQKNLGDGFADAVLWTNVDISADSDAAIAGSLSWYSTALAQASPVAYALNDIKNQLAQSWNNYLNSPNPKPAFQIPDSIMNAVTAVLNAQGAPRWGYFITRAREYATFNEYLEFVKSLYNSVIAESSLLIDMDGDKRPDRVFIKPHDSSVPNGRQDWYVQLNNGAGFEDAILWDSDVRSLPGSLNEKIATSLRVFNSWENPRNVVSDLRDVTGDGLPDRVTLSKFDDGTVQNIWWVEKNNGQGFDAALAWTGIEGTTPNETSITQDNEHFQNWSVQVSSPASVRKVSDLVDINGDHILDRVLYRNGAEKWRVQLGTGSGFLPSTEMKIEGLETGTHQISTSRYDYLHVSLKTAEVLPPNAGKVIVRLNETESSQNPIQEWEITDLTTSWHDFYLPVNESETNAAELKIYFVPSDGNTGSNPSFLVDNLTFTSFRPPAAKDWLDRLLTEEAVLADVYSERTQTLSQYLGLSEASEAAAFNWDALLNAETKIRFNAAGEADEFQTFYGSVSKIENGNVTETTLPDGSKVQFQTSEAGTAITQTVTHADGTTQSLSLSYGHVRTVSRPGKSALEYSYEFTPVSSSNNTLEEITVVYDPDTHVTERYREVTISGQKNSQLVSRTGEDGVSTLFFYDADGRLTRSEIVYKGRTRQTFEHSVSENGHSFLTTESGVIEEYDADGKIVAHTTPEGYRYLHSFERARKAVTSATSQTVSLPDGTTLTLSIPTIRLQEDPEGEQIHSMVLDSYASSQGNARYEGEVLKHLELPDGTAMEFERIEVKDVPDPVTGETKQAVSLLDAVIHHPDGSQTDFRDGKPYRAVTAAGRVLSIQKEGGFLLNGAESAEFLFAQAQKLWNETVKPQWEKFQAPGTLPVRIEYTAAEGKLITREFAEGAIEIYQDGRIQDLFSREGEQLIHYSYDNEGNSTRIEMGAARRGLESAVLKLKAEVAMERQKALADIAQRNQLLDQTIEGQYLVTRDRLLALRALIEAEKNNVMNLSVKGKQARGSIGEVMIQIQVGVDQVNDALESLAKQRADALAQLAEQVLSLSNQIEAETQESYAKIEAENQKMRRAIVKQEISPVLYHWYRKILGRDPSSAEYEQVIASADYDSGNFDLEAFKAELLQRGELLQRQQEVQAIKSKVEAELLAYRGMTEQAQTAYAQTLGILPSEKVSLSLSETESILSWLRSRSLHFGQSAYLALEALLSSAEISFSRVDLASRLILTDILTGTLTPLEQNDLVLSVYAMKRVAAGYGLQVDGYKMTYDALKALYNDACPQSSSENCTFKFISHINGNHYIIITKVTETEVYYTDPGAGAENALEQKIISKEEYLKTWIDPLKLNDGYGYIISARPPPVMSVQQGSGEQHYQILSTQESMEVRGAFFPALVAVFAAIAAVVNAIVNAVLTVISLIGSILQGIGAILQGFGQWIIHAFTYVHSSIVHGIQAVIGAVLPTEIAVPLASFVGGSAFGNALGMGLIGFALQGTGYLLEKIGFAPKLAQTIIAGGKLVVGAGLLASGNPIGLAAGIGLTAGGTTEFLSLHTNLSPAVTAIVGLGAAAVGAFAGGFNIGGISNAIASFKTAVPFLSQQFASLGVVSLGRSLGLDPRITALIGVPVAASLGGVIGAGSSGNILNAIKDALFSSQTLGGLISVGASIGLDALGAPPILQSFIPGLLGQLTAGATGSTGGGSTAGDNVGALQSGENLLGKIGDVANRLGSSLVHGAQNIISFGSQLILDGWEATKDFFSSIFSRQTQEVMYQSSVAGAVGGGTGALDVGFELINQTKEYDAQNNLVKVIEHYGNDAGDTATFIGDGLSNKISIEKNIAGKTFLETYENLGESSSGAVVLSGAVITENVGDNLQAQYIFKDGVFKRVDYIDINAQQTLSRIQAENNSKGLQFDEKGNLFTGVLENFFTGTAYAYKAGQLMSSSIIRKDSSGIFSISSIFDPLTKQVETVYEIGKEGMEVLYNTQIELYSSYLNIAEREAQILKQFVNDIYNLEGPNTKIYNSNSIPPLAAGVVAVDMELDWFNFFSANKLPLALSDIGFYAITANNRWQQAIGQAKSFIADQVRNKNNKFIFVPGVNSEVGKDLTSEKINALAKAFQSDPLTKQVVFCHSAGTEACLKSMQEAKADFYVFASPRTTREVFEQAISDSGLSRDQVLVVAVENDWYHWPSDKLFDMPFIIEGIAGKISNAMVNGLLDYSPKNMEQAKYNYMNIQDGPGMVSFPPGANHGIPIDGAKETESYTVRINNQPQQTKPLSEIFASFLKDEK